MLTPTLKMEMLAELLAIFKKSAREARRLQYFLSQIDQMTDEAANRLDDLVAQLNKIALLLRSLFGVTGLPELPVDAIRGISQLNHVVHELKWKQVARATFDIYIDGNEARPVRLTRQEWEFLRFLAEACPSADGLAASRNLEEIIAFLIDKTKTGDLKKYINHLVSRIRLALERSEFSPNLIQRDDQLSVRFAFKGNR